MYVKLSYGLLERLEAEVDSLGHRLSGVAGGGDGGWRGQRLACNARRTAAGRVRKFVCGEGDGIARLAFVQSCTSSMKMWHSAAGVSPSGATLCCATTCETRLPAGPGRRSARASPTAHAGSARRGRRASLARLCYRLPVRLSLGLGLRLGLDKLNPNIMPQNAPQLRGGS